MDIYFAYGPYHVFNAVNLAINENKSHESEIVIYRLFNGSEDIAKSLEGSRVFKNVYLLSENDSLILYGDPKRSTFSKILRRLGRSILNIPFFLSQYRYRNMPFYKKQYRNIYSPVAGGYLDGFIAKQCKNGSKFYLIEDGLGERVSSVQTIPKPFRYLGYLGIKSFWHFISGLYTYSPEVYISKHYYPIIKQERPKEDSDILKQIFQYKENEDRLKSAECIYFTQCEFDEQPIIDILSSKIPSLVVKVHPRLTNVYSAPNIVAKSIPIEIAMKFWDLDNKILISSHTAVMYNAKHIYDKEPYLIFLYKLIEGVQYGNITEEEFDLINQDVLIKHYRNPEKIFIPSTIEELELALLMINNCMHKTSCEIKQATQSCKFQKLN